MKEKKLMKLMKQRKVFQMNMMRVIPRRNSRNAKRKRKNLNQNMITVRRNYEIKQRKLKCLEVN